MADQNTQQPAVTPPLGEQNDSTQAQPNNARGQGIPVQPLPGSSRSAPDPGITSIPPPTQSPSDPLAASTAKSLPRIDVMDPRYQVYGIDAIWHNMYAFPTPSDYHPTPPEWSRRSTPEPVPREEGGPGYVERPFKGMRAWYDTDADGMVRMVARHVRLGWYSVISMSVSKHSCTVVCASRKGWEEFEEEWWDEWPKVEEGRAGEEVVEGEKVEE